MTSILDAQKNLREAYYGGAPGVVTLGTAWLIAAVVVCPALQSHRMLQSA